MESESWPHWIAALIGSERILPDWPVLEGLDFRAFLKSGILDHHIGSLDPQRRTDEVVVSPNALVRIVGPWSVGWP